VLEQNMTINNKRSDQKVRGPSRPGTKGSPLQVPEPGVAFYCCDLPHSYTYSSGSAN